MERPAHSSKYVLVHIIRGFSETTQFWELPFGRFPSPLHFTRFSWAQGAAKSLLLWMTSESTEKCTVSGRAGNTYLLQGPKYLPFIMVSVWCPILNKYMGPLYPKYGLFADNTTSNCPFSAERESLTDPTTAMH